jgi:GNAT superfamily N-acetyltransferase
MKQSFNQYTKGVTAVEDDVPVQLVHAWDEDEIADLYRAGGWWKEEYDPMELRNLIHGSFAFAVAVDPKTGCAIGMGRVISDGVSDGYIQDLVVMPEYRGTGIGAQIVSKLVKKCLDAGSFLDWSYRRTGILKNFTRPWDLAPWTDIFHSCSMVIHDAQAG